MVYDNETGEAWLKRAELALRPNFTKAGLSIPDNIRYAVAFPSAGARSTTIGECWYAAASSDNRHTIIIRADQTSTVDVLGILIHELLHASLPPGTGHGPVFARYMPALHLTGKATATVLSHAGRIACNHLQIFQALGGLGDVPWGKLLFAGNRRDVPEGPDGPLVADRPKTQTTRMLKACCPTCGYTVRLAKSWAAKGLPSCPTDSETFTLECE